MSLGLPHRSNHVLRLDLHTHPGEATPMKPPSLAIARAVVEQIRACGLDGIAVTEHYDADYAFILRDMIHAEFGSASPLIIPGWEVYEGLDEVVELFLPSGAVFRFMPHPAHPERADALSFPIHGIEIANKMHGNDFDAQLAQAVAERHGLMTLRNSDGHAPSAIGSYYNELSLETLERAASERPTRNWQASLRGNVGFGS